MSTFDKAIIVTSRTRLEQLIERFNTRDQARFYIGHSGGDFEEYQKEHDTFCRARDRATDEAVRHTKVKLLDRKFLPNFIFSEQDIIVALGQDGLVANTAKYSKGLPILGVNPDPTRNDGILLPFSSGNFENALLRVLENKFTARQVTMALAVTQDGQSLMAFNDLFIGPASHTSARYKISFGETSENQSSSGLIISTGAGSTGWLSSVINMSNAVNTTFHGGGAPAEVSMNWDDDELAFVVREPFRSKHSQVNITAGMINSGNTLRLESHMPFNGVIFSDGIEADFLQFNSGCKVEIKLAEQKARIVI